MRLRFIGQSVVPVAIALSFAAVCHACPTCKEGIAEGSHYAGIIQGYFWSILFMMSMPFVIFGGLGAYFYYQVRQARAAADIETPEGVPDVAANARSLTARPSRRYATAEATPATDHA